MTRALATLLLVPLLAGCRAAGPGPLDVHEVALYGAVTGRVLWVYGPPGPRAGGTVTLDGARVAVGEPVAGPLAVPGTVGVGGQPVHRAPTRPLASPVTATVVRAGSVRLTSGPGVTAAFVTDGARWWRLAGVNGTVAAAPATALRGAGRLTDPEADALAATLLGRGPLVVAVLADAAVPDPPVTVDPPARQALRTGLYVAPTTPAPTTAPPGDPVPPNPATPTPAPGDAVPFTVLGSGTNAAAPTLSVRVATTAAQAATIYAVAYGRQTPVPAAPDPAGGTVVGIFLGQRPSGGYSVAVTDASAAGDVLTVRARVRAPGPGSFTTQALTSPWTVIRVPGTYAQVTVTDDAGRPLPAGPAPTPGTDR